MIEDKLTRDERLRLEALAQSIMYHSHPQRNTTSDDIVRTATKFESFVKEAKD